IPIGLLLASAFVCASAFVDLRPWVSRAVRRHRVALRLSVITALALWSLWALAELPPLGGPSGEAGGATPPIPAAIGALVYVVSATRFLTVYRRNLTLLPASVIACCTLLAEALLGSALVGERTWHASWWEWHALIVTAYAVVLYAARSQWRQERFH